MNHETDTNDLKQTLRQQALKQRYQIEQHVTHLENFYKLFDQHIIIEKDDIVAFYWPVNGEFDVTDLMLKIHDKDIVCALPKVIEDDPVLRFGRWTPKCDMKTSTLNIMEPETIDYIDPTVLVVPLLAFDRQGYRLGYGGGYYDQTIATLHEKHHIQTIGVAYDEQLCLFPLPRDDHDQKLDWIITPSQVYQFEN